MSIISHIVNQLNSLIQCRTISVDLTSNILRKQLSIRRAAGEMQFETS